MDATDKLANYFVQRIDGQVLAQLESCLQCGLCASACPFFLGTDNPEHVPIRKIEPLKVIVQRELSPGRRLFSWLGLTPPRPDEVTLQQWVSQAYLACTVCNRCALACPMGLDLGSLIQLTREGLAAAGLVPPSLADAVERQKHTGSPLGVPQDLYEDRLRWISEEEGVTIPLDVEGAESLVVFTSIELIKFPGNIAALAKILNTAGEHWTMSTAGREAVNFATFSGETEEQVAFVKRITEAALQLNVRRIILSECGHAYDTVRRIAGRLYGQPLPFQIENVLETISRLIATGRIRLRRDVFNKERITFHDACKLQRLGGLIEEPRFILNTIAPTSFVEMTPNREAQLCCGGGGGVIANPEADEIRMKAFLPKVEQLESILPDVVVTACSTCRLQFIDGTRYYNLDVTVRGITEMVAEALITDG